ncbi:hypothetical protein RA263_27180 [Pseudomonas syringae pv. tagetis]|uniref:Uncharacterized protein n=1 Tax=Pseudomonas syringae pv. tagetis TaxID=129140 RepID=A0ABW7NVD6_9PSED|nr:hypothetical protein [Pseudomonas syringae group genomosp. 7]
MATPISWPSEVVAAATIEFKAPVTAYLWMPEPEYPCLIGRVFMDRRGRFDDGRLIRTSTVMSLRVEAGCLLARTFSGSDYVLVQGLGQPISNRDSFRSVIREPDSIVH